MNKTQELEHIAKPLGKCWIWYGDCSCIYDNRRWKRYGWHYRDYDRSVYLGANFAIAKKAIEGMIKK